MRFLIRFLKRNAKYKGLFGGSSGWLRVFGVFTAASLIGKYVGRNEQLLAKEVLNPGQSMTVSAIAPPTPRQRRTSKRDDKSLSKAAEIARVANKAAVKQAKKSSSAKL